MLMTIWTGVRRPGAGSADGPTGIIERAVTVRGRGGEGGPGARCVTFVMASACGWCVDGGPAVRSGGVDRDDVRSNGAERSQCAQRSSSTDENRRLL